MRVAALGSGSRGNGFIVAHGATCILVDCGFSLRRTRQRLSQLGLDGADLTAILVTHEHSDHSAGVRTLAQHHGLPVYLSHGSARHPKLSALALPQLIRGGQAFTVGDLTVKAVTVPHDAREPCQFVFEAGGQRVGLLTDLGHISAAVLEAYDHCDGLFLEANHDEQMLAQGSYPVALKRRVGGRWGHLSNRQCRQLLEGVSLQRLQWLVVGHISEQNNTPALVKKALPEERLAHCRVSLAGQDRVLDWIDLH